jgi:hypothetical protein
MNVPQVSAKNPYQAVYISTPPERLNAFAILPADTACFAYNAKYYWIWFPEINIPKAAPKIPPSI